MATKKPKQKTEWTKDELAALRAQLVEHRKNLTNRAHNYATSVEEHASGNVVFNESASDLASELRDVSQQILTTNFLMRHIDTLLRILGLDAAQTTNLKLTDYDTGMEAQP